MIGAGERFGAGPMLLHDTGTTMRTDIAQGPNLAFVTDQDHALPRDIGRHRIPLARDQRTDPCKNPGALKELLQLEAEIFVAGVAFGRQCSAIVDNLRSVPPDSGRAGCSRGDGMFCFLHDLALRVQLHVPGVWHGKCGPALFRCPFLAVLCPFEVSDPSSAAMHRQELRLSPEAER